MQYTEKLEPHGANIKARMLGRKEKPGEEGVGQDRSDIYICQRR